MTHHAGFRRSIVHRLAVVLAMGFALVGLSQCRLTNDSITGIEMRARPLNGDGPSCVGSCNQQFSDNLVLENARHRDALQACDDQACRDAENITHDQNVEDIRAANDRCKHSCYNEGGGRGGVSGD